MAKKNKSKSKAQPSETPKERKSKDIVEDPSVHILLSGPQSLSYDKNGREKKDKGTALEVKTGIDKAMTIAASKFFEAGLSGNFLGGLKDGMFVVDVPSIDIGLIVLEAVHGVRNQDYSKISIKDLFRIFELCDYWLINPKILRAWFLAWLSSGATSGRLKCAEHVETCVCVEKELLFPSWHLKTPKVFLEVSRHLVYHSPGPIWENLRTRDTGLLTPPSIIAQLNAVRVHLRTDLEDQFMESMVKALASKCHCKEKTVQGFKNQMKKHDLYPAVGLAFHAKETVTETINRCRAFEYKGKGCGSCGKDHGQPIKEACDAVGRAFQGLCLDCIDQPRFVQHPWLSDEMPKGQLSQEQRDRICKSLNCSSRHGYMSWFFSFYCRKYEVQREGRAIAYD